MDRGETVHVRLTPYEHGVGIKTELDGVEVREVTDIRLACPVDEIPRLTLEVLAQPGLEVTLPAAVHVVFNVPEGCSLIDVTTQDNDGKKYRVVRVS